MHRRAALAALGLASCLVPALPARPAAAFPGATIPEPAPALTVTTVMAGLTNAWDVAFTPDGAMFVTERPGRIHVRRPNGTTAQLAANLSDIWVSGETGLMSIEVDPGFAQNRRVYTCQGTTDVAGGNVDGTSVQVVAWTIDAGYTALTRASDPLVGGIAGTTGRHGGCQLRVDTQGFLRVGTGDAATGTLPQNTFSLNGKTLRVDRFTGAGVTGNPFLGGGGDPRVFTYGHRNVQGLSVNPLTGEVWSAEHGPTIDDEVNRLVAGGNYGWNPVPGYNENVPMTDFAEFPGAIGAQWSSGSPTIATSGVTFLRGSHWGPWQGALAVGTLNGQSLRVMRFGGGNELQSMAIPPELNGTVGRIRAAEMGPCGVLYLTTDAGGGGSRVLAVQPVVNAQGPAVTATDGSTLHVARCGPVEGDVQVRSGDGSSWSGWQSIGGRTLSEPALSSWGGNRLDVFVLGLDGAIWHRGGQAGALGAWETLGGMLTSAPSAVSWGVNRIDVFARGMDGSLYANAWTGTGWRGWLRVPSLLSSAPEAAVRAPGVIDVFTRGIDNAMYHLVWSGQSVLFFWERLGGGFTAAPAAISWGGGRLDVFGRGLDGALWSSYWSGSGWSGWYPLGGQLRSAPDAASRGFDSWDVLVEGIDGRFYLRSWTGAGFTPYSVLPA